MNGLGIEFLTTIGLPPLEFIRLAADVGCPNISFSLNSVEPNPLGYPSFSLVENKDLRRDVKTALADHGVSISLGEGFLVMPGVEIGDRQPALDVMQELGVRRVNTVSIDPDLARTFDQFAIFVEMASAMGMEATHEFAPGLTVADLPTALAVLRHVGSSNFKLVIDTMHFFRSGAQPAQLAALDPALIGYVQLSDVPRVPTIADYMEEAMFNRLPPGEGELPLVELLSLIPRDIVISLETPQLAEALRGVGPRERIGRSVTAARALLARVPAQA
jgi:sugar phosphate isomerase/epimerase